MLDEIDKLGMDFRGDPSSALLEVLDPEQNAHFSDHYLEVPFDLSRVIFVTTANLLDPIPPALRDRMEVIQIPGYTEEEKLHIARRFLMPRQFAQHGLADGQLTLPDDTVRQLIRGYTKEAGVRNLEREIAHVCRKVAKRIVEGSVETMTVAPDDLARHLDPPRFEALIEERRDEVGVAYGLTVSEVGGDVMAVEATWMEGKPRLTLTGQLGNVMQESAQAALTVARQQARSLGLEASFFEQHALHVHVPAGSVPKDGPSAGITMTTAIVAAMTGRLVRSDVAMTGEITLRGRVLPIGGVKHKVLAAHRAGVRAVILPAENKQDLSEIPEEIRKDIELIWVDHINAVLKRVLRPARPAVPVPAAPWLKPAEASPAVPLVAT
jgi:ATP-dependent Lon protease